MISNKMANSGQHLPVGFISLFAAQSAVGQRREKTDYPDRFMQAFQYPISLIR
jgi:hypothetical protein